MSGSRGATCHVQNESNMSSNGTHERYMETCDWVEIYVRWIKDKVESKSTNEGLTCGMRGQVLLTKFSQLVWGEEKRGRDQRKRERKGAREREPTFSVGFPTIRPTISSEARRRVDPHSQSFTSRPELRSFDKLQEIGVFSYLIYCLAKCHSNG